LVSKKKRAKANFYPFRRILNFGFDNLSEKMAEILPKWQIADKMSVEANSL
jgi:hypothetical protein